MIRLLGIYIIALLFPITLCKHLRRVECAGWNKTVPVIGCLLCGAHSKSYNKSRLRRTLTEVSDKFQQIYKDEIWGPEGGGSGFGSDRESAYHTGYLVELLMYKYGLTSMLDAPCGAVHSSWTQDFIHRIHSNVPCFRYHGVDVALTVIAKNNEAFQQKKRVSFAQMDLSDKSVGLFSHHDIILSRDALQHLSYAKIADVFHQYCLTECSYVLLGSYLDPDTGKNEDIAVGDTFCINVRLPPFLFPKPLEIIREAIPTESRKYLLLYKLDQLCGDHNLLNFIEKYASATEPIKLRGVGN